MSQHSATGSFAGYLYQIERVLFWISKSDICLVGLETEDDIVAHFSGQSDPGKILEQAKHSISSNVPFSDKSVDLWKTLSIWISNELDPNYDHHNDSYSLVSNKTLPTNRLIYKIVTNKNKEVFGQYVDELLAIAREPSKGIKPYADILYSCPRNTLESILKKIEIDNGEEVKNTKRLKEFLKANLSIGN